MERAKEVGIRKVSGAFRSQVFFQFIIESLILTSVALFLSFVLIALVLPAFNELAGKNLIFSDIASTPVLVAAAIIICAITLLAGSYPAFFLSSFQPVAVLKSPARRWVFILFP